MIHNLYLNQMKRKIRMSTIFIFLTENNLKLDFIKAFKFS